MAKKTVLKKCLKYAPLKSDFVKAITMDGTIKNELSDDMFSVPSTYIEVDGEVLEIDAETGEVASSDA